MKPREGALLVSRRAFLAAAALAPLARAEAEGGFAIVGARALLPGAVEQDGVTVLVAGERIRAVGAGVAVPAGVRAIDARGAWVTPGFIDAATRVGMVEVELEPQASDVDRSGDPLQPAFRALDAYNPRSELVAVARQGGVTSVVVAPSAGVLAGQSAFVDLAGDSFAQAVVRPALAAHLAIGGAAAHALGGARAALWMHLREAFEDARAFGKRRAQFEDNRARPFKLGRAQLEALQPVLRREQPLVVSASRQSDLEAAIAFADAFGLRLVLAGAVEAWRLADELARRKIPVIVHPTEDLPSSFDALHVVPDLAARLRKAGVPVVISTFDALQVRLLWQEAGNAARMGLPHAEALRAVTEAPADAFGIADRGRLAPGAVANLVVWSGDPLETSTRVAHLFVRGREIAPRDRQRLLLERYRDVPLGAPPRKG